MSDKDTARLLHIATEQLRGSNALVNHRWWQLAVVAELLRRIVESDIFMEAESVHPWLKARGDEARAQLARTVVPHPDAIARPVDHRVLGVTAHNSLHGAFLAGAKWWEFESTKGTMWASDRDKAWAEAERRYGPLPTTDKPEETA